MLRRFRTALSSRQYRCGKRNGNDPNHGVEDKITHPPTPCAHVPHLMQRLLALRLRLVRALIDRLPECVGVALALDRDRVGGAVDITSPAHAGLPMAPVGVLEPAGLPVSGVLSLRVQTHRGGVGAGRARARVFQFTCYGPHPHSAIPPLAAAREKAVSRPRLV